MKIFGYNYTIVEDGDSDLIGAWGRFHGKTQVLQIATGLTAQQRESTILHEVIEAANYHLELDLKHSTRMSLETALYQVLTDNGVDLSPLLPKEEK